MIGGLALLGLANFQKNLFIQYFSFLLVLFLFCQTLFGGLYLRCSIIKLMPNLKVQLRVIGDALPGISGTVRISTDNNGFKVTKSINYERKSPYRVFAIGGSTIEEPYIDEKNTSWYLLQTWLETKFNGEGEVVDAGVSGTRARNHLAALTEIERFHPNLVVIMMGANDWNRDITMAEKPLWGRLILSTRNLLVGHNTEFLNSPLCRMVKPLFNKDVLQTGGVDRGEYFVKQRNSLERKIRYAYHPEQVSDDYQRYVKEILEKCKGGNYKCLLLSQISAYQPGTPDELKRLFWMTPPNEPYTLSFEDMVYIANLYNKFLAAEAKKMNIPLCDAASGIPPTTEYFFDDMHLNVRGAALLAELIIDCIKKHNLLSPQN